MNPHICNGSCDALALRDAHERSRLSARRKRQTKIKGHRPKVRWTAARGPGAPYAWIDEAWAAVWG